MCEPTTLAVAAIGLSAVSSGASLVQQSRAAGASRDHQQQLHDSNAEIANADAITNFVALSRQQLEQRSVAAAAISDVTRQGRLARGTAAAGAAASGVQGGSVDALLGEFERQELEFQTRQLRTLEGQEANADVQRLGIANQRQGRILSSLPQPVQGPDFIGAGARFFGGSIKTLSQFGLIGQQDGTV